MNMTDLPASVGDPIESLFAFHRRIERQLAALGRLPGHIEAFGTGAEAAAIAAGVLQCFGTALAAHHEEEERILLPLLERRLPPPMLAPYRELLARLQADHREMTRAWRELRRPLEAISEGLLRRLSVTEIQYFRAITSMHISIEEGTLQAWLARHLRHEDRDALAHRLAHRRAVTNSSSR